MQRAEAAPKQRGKERRKEVSRRFIAQKTIIISTNNGQIVRVAATGARARGICINTKSIPQRPEIP